MITIRGLTRRFGDQVVLDRLDLDLPDGTVTALLGPNGSGKTTLARLLLGLDTPDSGTLTGLTGCRRAAVFQEDRLCPQLDAVRNIRLVLDHGAPSCTPTAITAELRAAGLPEDALTKPVRDLSGGQRRTVAIVRALLAEADLLILDEPCTGLDAAVKPRVLDLIGRHLGRRATVLITHDPAEARSLGARIVRLTRQTPPGTGTGEPPRV